ncbi:cupin domain-containing protein [Proteiniclasticum sp.]|uniref:cupin domain-containing protein n=1 Tax=Proteiniclasticum sp. TaxID=2053595 RepID=UPI0028A10FAB|nr:cupin domain-containing protein [Proteiniclasticum sp.]
MFVYNQEVERVNCDEGVYRKILSYNEDMMMCEIEFKRGAVGARHAHPHLQVTYIIRGSFEFTIGDETKVVKAGDSLLMPPDVPHGTLALEDGMLVDVFSPMREDFLK